MANRITDECTTCGVCEPECPNEAISLGADIYVIDPTLCDECAQDGGDPACMDVCPCDGAIVKV
jgi:ferredoxin